MRLYDGPYNALAFHHAFCRLQRADHGRLVLEFWCLPCHKRGQPIGAGVTIMASMPDILNCVRILVFVTLSFWRMCKIFLRQCKWNLSSFVICGDMESMLHTHTTELSARLTYTLKPLVSTWIPWSFHWREVSLPKAVPDLDRREPLHEIWLLRQQNGFTVDNWLSFIITEGVGHALELLGWHGTSVFFRLTVRPKLK